MDLSGYSITELIDVLSESIKELKMRGVLRTKNVVGELGEYLVLEYYDRSNELPTLTIVPVGTKNINAISSNGERYTIKSTTGNVTGVIYGLQPPGSSEKDDKLFEYMVICKLDEDYGLEGIYQISWDSFQKHKKWHSRMQAWNITITKAVKNDSLVVYEKNSKINKGLEETDNIKTETDKESFELGQQKAITWNKTKSINHVEVRADVVKRLQKKFKCNFEKESQSRYVTPDKERALFVLSASYSQKNGEYWYSINDENIPWLELFPESYIAFALGSPKQILLFTYEQLKVLLDGCLRTKEDPEKNKKAHYHFSFAVEGSIVYFKKKLPEKDFVNVTTYLL